MEHNKVSVKEVIQNIGARNLISVFLILLAAVAVIAMVTSSLYSYVKAGIYLRTEMNARQSAEEFEKYLLPSINSVQQTGYSIDHMLQQGRSNRDIIRMSKRDIITQNLNRQLMTTGDLFDSMIEIGIPIDLFREIDGDQHTKLGAAGEQGQAQAVLNAAVLLKVDESFREQLHQFVDLSTLSERMLGKDTITTEFLDTKQAWYRGRFIVAERDSAGNVMRVLWIIHSIDEEKKERARLVQLTETDGLTGIANRRGGEQKISELVQDGKGGMFIILDVNLFKSINDTYGHQTGDKALIGIANCLNEAFRSGDVVLRLGGDEFAAYAIGVTSQAAGQGIIDRLFAHVDALRIPEMGGKKITISVGATIFDGSQSLQFRDLYEQADASVYISKSKDKSESHVTFYAGQSLA